MVKSTTSNCKTTYPQYITDKANKDIVHFPPPYFILFLLESVKRNTVDIVFLQRQFLMYVILYKLTVSRIISAGPWTKSHVSLLFM